MAVTYDGGVILGADSRTSTGSVSYILLMSPNYLIICYNHLSLSSLFLLFKLLFSYCNYQFLSMLQIE